jgi:N-acetylmuramic acid 6-phosphate etherase
VVGVIAGGARALRRSIEGAEDDAAAAARALELLRLSPNDAVVGIAASGRTPYTVAALRYARRQGALTVAVACSPRSPLAAAAAIAIEPITGAEALTGSTRLKAGTAQKMVLNQLSTGVMVRTGRVRGNLMTAMQASNQKLRDRAERILATALDGDRTRARRLLRRFSGNLERALAHARGETTEKP